MTRPRLIDLFCGAGAASMGYHRAGFDVTGVDIEPQPYYPFRFVQADALRVPLDGYDVVHASPPCQGYSRMRHLPWLKDKDYPLLIDPVRERLQASVVPWVIENVEDSPLLRSMGLFGVHGVLLCGSMFGLGVWRHRPFESNVALIQPAHPQHAGVIQRGRMLGSRDPGVTGISAWQKAGGVAGHMANVDRARAAMGIDWPMPRSGVAQAIPPAYTEFIGRQLLELF